MYSDQDRTNEWLNTLFENNPKSPGSKLAHPDRLVFPDGAPASAEQAKERNTVYTFESIQNAYRVLYLCSMDDNPSKTESLLHAHAESFLKRAYAAWNLWGTRREEFERTLKVYVNTTLSDLFAMHAPICKFGTNEILALQDVHRELEAARAEAAVLRAEIQRRDDALAELRQKLSDAESRDRYFAQNLADSIEGATAEQRAKYEYLRKNTDTVVAAATQEKEMMLQATRKQLGACQFDFTNLMGKFEKETLQSEQRLLQLAEKEVQVKQLNHKLATCGEYEPSSCIIV
jgi:hypothetical protein